MTISNKLTNLQKFAFAYAGSQESSFTHIGNGIPSVGEETFAYSNFSNALILPELTAIDGTHSFNSANAAAIVILNEKITFNDVSTNDPVGWQQQPKHTAFCGYKGLVYVSKPEYMSQIRPENIDNTGNSNTRDLGIYLCTNGGVFDEGTVFAPGQFAEPYKVGYLFQGWYEGDNSGNITGTDAVKTPEARKSYYAKWEECREHIVAEDAAVAATCTKPGKTAGSHCSKCRLILVAQEETEMVPHSEILTSSTPPSYDSTGTETYTCIHCGATRRVIIPQLVDTGFDYVFTPSYPTGGTGGGTGTTTPPSTITDNPTPLDPGTTITDDDTPLDRLPLLFRDVADDMWYRDAVAYVFDRGLMKGISETTFAPTLSTERGMIVTILHRLEGEPNAAASAFTDVAAGEWYTDAVAWGAANGVVKGYSDTIFKPTQDITREQLAAILYRYAQLKGYDTGKRADLSAYTDAGDLSAYALEAMQWAVAEELISGVTSYTLVPGGRADRAQVAMILMRFCERIVPAE